MTSRPPPDFRGKKIVFDDTWHPLDHWIGSARCRSFQPEGRNPIRTHARYWYDFGPRPKPYYWAHRALGCWWGRHTWQTWWGRASGNEEWREVTSCKYCYRRRTDG